MQTQKAHLFYLVLLLIPCLVKAQAHDVNFYLEQAKMNSPVLNKSANDNKLITLNIKQIKALLSRPEISIDGIITFAPIISHDNNMNRFEWVSAGASNYTGYDLALTDGGQYQAGVFVKQPLFRGSEFKAYTRKGLIASQINDSRMDLNLHQLKQLVNYQYLLCLKSEKQIEFSQGFLQQMDQQVEIMEKLVANAIYKKADLILLKIERDNIEAIINVFKSDYKRGQSDLNILCGINDTSTVKISDEEFEIKGRNITQSHFLTSYILDSLTIVADQYIFNKKYNPKLYIFANAGLNAIYLPEFNRLGFSTGLTFRWTIFDGHQRDIQQQKSVINRNTIEFEKQNFEKQIFIQKSKYLYQIQSLKDREKMARNQIKKYSELVEIYQKELPLGVISVMDLKNLMKDIFKKKQELVLLKMQKQVMINSYNYWNY